MVTFLKGNLFNSPAQVLTNTVNTVGVMGKGIALEFKQRFPGMYDDYSKRCKEGLVKLGEPYLWEDESNQVLNFPTKAHWKAGSRLEDIELGLRYLAEHYQNLGIASIAMPSLGCGNGGLDWNEVRPLFEKYLGAVPDLEVFVYEPDRAKSSANLGEEFKSSKVAKRVPIAALPERGTR